MPPGVQETSLSEPTEEDKLIDPANDRQFPWSGDFQDDDVPPFPATLSEQVSLSDDVGGIQRAAPMDGAVQQQYRPWEHRYTCKTRYFSGQIFSKLWELLPTSLLMKSSTEFCKYDSKKSQLKQIFKKTMVDQLRDHI